jgi:hypothetical protein
MLNQNQKVCNARHATSPLRCIRYIWNEKFCPEFSVQLSIFKLKVDLLDTALRGDKKVHSSFENGGHLINGESFSNGFKKSKNICMHT